MENLITAIVGYLSNFEFLALAFVIQKVVFLESHTVQQFRTFLRLILYVTIFVVGVHLLMPFLPGSDLKPLIFLAIFMAGYMVVPLIYVAYTGRKTHKWLAFFEFIPIIGCVDGVFGLIDLLKELIPGEIAQNILCNLLLPLVVIVAFAMIAWKKPKFLRSLVRDIRNRSLTVGEEVVVWLVGIWLFVYDMFIGDYLEANTSHFVLSYITVLNFVAASVIIAFVINSNYREFYYKRNLHLQKSLISAMADLVENRDENTGGHIQRTSRYVEIIARKLRNDGKFVDILTDKYIEDMVIAAPLHDVGKIHIPDAILNKPGKLDAEEFSTMKTHSAAGGAIISHIESDTGEIEYLKIAKQMAEYHHERMDGKGYPHGLKGDEIPLCARILAVADVFDAVSSKRCYKEAFSLEKSFDIIKEETGSHFDEEVAQAFLDSREAVVKCFKELSQEEVRHHQIED